MFLPVMFHFSIGKPEKSFQICQKSIFKILQVENQLRILTIKKCLGGKTI